MGWAALSALMPNGISYRDASILERPLTKEEAREVTMMTRRIASLILMEDQLNANYIVARDSVFLVLVRLAF
jgi:hypothetical protein